MTSDDVPGWTILGRPVKSTAFGLAIIMATFTIYNILDIGVFHTSILGDIVAVIAGVVFIMLVCGWWFRSQWMAENGLLGVAAVYITRSAFLLLINPSIEGVWIGVGVAVIAAGAYLKERVHAPAVM